MSETLEAALELSYKAAAKVHFENMHYRRDIGRAALGTASHALY